MRALLRMNPRTVLEEVHSSRKGSSIAKEQTEIKISNPFSYAYSSEDEKRKAIFVRGKAKLLFCFFGDLGSFFILQINDQVPDKDDGEGNGLGDRDSYRHKMIRLFARDDMKDIDDGVVDEMVAHGHIEVSGEFADESELEAH